MISKGNKHEQTKNELIMITGRISDALRNMIMKHADTGVFLKHYLSTTITVDTQAVVRGSAPQDKIMQAQSSMSRYIDLERPRVLTKEQKRSVAKTPLIREMQKKQNAFDKGSKGYKDLQRKIQNEKKYLRYHLRKRIREEWDSERAEKDIRLQISGAIIEEKIKTDPRCLSERSKPHVKLIDSIFSLPGRSIEEENDRRSNAIRAVWNYCEVEEGSTPKDHEVDLRANHGSRNAVDMDVLALASAIREVFGKYRTTICFICLGNGNLPVKERVHAYSSPGNLTKHFHTHVKKFNAETDEVCNLCKARNEKEEIWKFTDRNSMKLHAWKTHGINFGEVSSSRGMRYAELIT